MSTILPLETPSHESTFGLLLLVLFSITLAGGVGRMLALRVGQPAVLGELLAGIILGNILCYFGNPLGFLIRDPHIGAPLLYKEVALSLGMLSSFGVVLLLFMVGLENTLTNMVATGGRALLIATVGVVAPFALGMGVAALLLPEMSLLSHLFISATLCATSVGITARVFRDLGVSNSSVARLILGAAVIDDLFGLIILAVVAGIVTTGSVDTQNILLIIGKAILFLSAVILFGKFILPKIIKSFRKLFYPRPKVLLPLACCFFFSWLASYLGLAAIIGAFLSGLILSDLNIVEEHENEENIDDLIAPIELLFAPIFFVMMGMQVDILAFLNPLTLGLGVVLAVAGIIGKLVCALFTGKEPNYLSVGIGMVPRGEVGLIFAGVGKTLGVVSQPIFASLVFMVFITTVITPPLLKLSLRPRL